MFLSSSCAYYNGMYNARQSMRRADALAQKGLTDSASVHYARAAEAAEYVLRRHADSPWKSEALLLSGQASAQTGACATATDRLTTLLAVDSLSLDDRARASLAFAVCNVQNAEYAAAATRLEAVDMALTQSDSAVAVSPEREELRRAVRRWRARIALAMNDVALADQLLQALSERDAPWERAAFAVSQRDWARADAILVARATVGDVHPMLEPLLRDASALRQYSLVSRVADAYAGSEAPRAIRARVQLLAGDAAVFAGDSATARTHYMRVLTRALADSTTVRDASARLTQMAVMRADSVPALRALLDTAPIEARGSAVFDRIEAATVLFLSLYDADDPSGAAWYLAGEVARDSLSSPRLALSVWRELERRWPDAPVTPRALYAAHLLAPDSASVLKERLQSRYGASAMSALLRGEGVSDSAEQRAADALLDSRWRLAVRGLDEALRLRRSAARADTSRAPSNR
jgi:hypothetical protein